MARIAEALNVTTKTISKDLAETGHEVTTGGGGDGRRKGSRGNSKTPEWQAVADSPTVGELARRRPLTKPARADT
jgi:hypothetical protein